MGIACSDLCCREFNAASVNLAASCWATATVGCNKQQQNERIAKQDGAHLKVDSDASARPDRAGPGQTGPNQALSQYTVAISQALF